jgi:hypothetical protein
VHAEFAPESNQATQKETSSIGASPEDDRDSGLQKDPSDLRLCRSATRAVGFP